jgi:hypothetical protein
MTTQARTTAPPRERETYEASFLRLLALGQSIEKTLGEMLAILDTTPDEVVARALSRALGGNQRREA